MSARLDNIASNQGPCLTSIFLDVTKNVFYWSRVAIVVAQGSGMHRRLACSIRGTLWSHILTSIYK